MKRFLCRLDLDVPHQQRVCPHQDLRPHHLAAEPGQGDLGRGQEAEDHRAGAGEGVRGQAGPSHLLPATRT